SCSQVKPTPPWTWRPDAITRRLASEHHVFAVDAATEASGSPAPRHHAAQYAADRMPSTSTSMSAQRCLTAWKLPMGLPNCTRARAPRDAADGVPCHQPRHRFACAAARQRPESKLALDEGGGGDVPPDLLEEHGRFDHAQAESPIALGDLDAHPALVDHRLPE